MRKVVVGFDGHVESDDALALGSALAEPDRAQLHVAIVLRASIPFEEAIAGDLSEQLDREFYASANANSAAATS
jgi:hypothetical protein